jgi:hypothetical protein
VPHTVARRPRSRWPGLSAAATLSQFPKPALQHTLRRTLRRFHSRSHRKNFRHSMRLFRDHLVRTSRQPETTGTTCREHAGASTGSLRPTTRPSRHPIHSADRYGAPAALLPPPPPGRLGTTKAIRRTPAHAAADIRSAERCPIRRLFLQITCAFGTVSGIGGYFLVVSRDILRRPRAGAAVAALGRIQLGRFSLAQGFDFSAVQPREPAATGRKA